MKTRLVEINQFGQFRVFGDKPFFVAEYQWELMKNPGWFIYNETLPENVLPDARKHNALFKLNPKTKQIIPALFTSKEMAMEVCNILNAKL